MELEIQTDKDEYEPNDIVNFEVTVRDKNTGETVEDDTFISIVVTDESVFG